MKKIFDKYETAICLLLIIIYIVSNSYCVQHFGITDYRTVIINSGLSFLLIMLMYSLNRLSYYGLRKPLNSKEYFYFIPLLLIVSVNLWNGIHIQNTNDEILCHILTMINVGFIEEIIFRGFLFRMMEKDNIKLAVIVSSLTFGVGHIINLFNGAFLLETLLQVCYAITIGFLFVIILCKTKSLIPCIVTHCLMNSLSIFNSSSFDYLSGVFLVVVPIVYSIYIVKVIK